MENFDSPVLNMLKEVRSMERCVRNLRSYFNCVQPQFDYVTSSVLDEVFSNISKSVDAAFFALLDERDRQCDTQQ